MGLPPQTLTYYCPQAGQAFTFFAQKEFITQLSQVLIRGFRPKPRLTFCLDTKSKQKDQDFACFARKIYVRKAQIVQTC